MLTVETQKEKEKKKSPVEIDHEISPKDVGYKEVGRWKRKHKQVEKHLTEAQMLCTNLANEVKALREQILGYQQFEESANEQLEELANNLTISTKEIDEKTNALTVAMMEVEQLKVAIMETKQDGNKCSELEKCSELNKCSELDKCKTLIGELQGKVTRRDDKLQKMKVKYTKLEKDRQFLIQQVKTMASSKSTRVNEKGELVQSDQVDIQKDHKNDERVVLMEEEIKELRKQIILGEENRKADLQRQMQILHGKDQESEYIWQKYVQAVGKT